MIKKTALSKREFLKLSFAGAIGLTTSRSLKASGSPLDYNPDKIITRTLGKTGFRLPIVSSGILPIQNLNLVRAIFRSGIRHIDSAWDYEEGRNDEMVGRMLKEFGRDKYVVSTKILLDIDYKNGNFSKAATYDAFMKQLEITLGRLDLECVDLLYLHKPPTYQAALHESMLKGLIKAKEQGKTKFIGYSFHSNQSEIIRAALDSNIIDVLLVGYNFFQDAQPVKEAIARAAAKGIGIVGMKILGGYYYDKDRTQPVMRSAAMKWVLQDPNVNTIILTIKSFEQLEESLPMLYNIDFTEEERKHIESHRNIAGLYCRGCNECLAQCPKHLSIPEFMRAYMYAYGYRSTKDARKVLLEIKNIDNPCKSCDACKVRCSMNMNVADRIADVTRLHGIPDDFLV